MKERIRHINPYTLIYTVVLLFIILYIFFASDIDGFLNGKQKSDIVEFGENWKMEDGSFIADIKRIPSPDDGSEIVLTKQLPDDIVGEEALNFDSHNVYFTLRIGRGEPYEFYLEENLTGRGYGDSFHNILLTEKMRGETVTITAKSAFPGENSGGFENVKLGSHHAYYHWFVKKHGISAVLSLMIIFFGVVVFTVRFGIVGRRMGDYDLTALGVTMILTGTWTLLETKIPQMLTGANSFIRALDYILLWFTAYPMVVFINSLTKKHKKSYNIIVFCISMISIFLTILLRFLAGIDMHRLTAITHVSFGVDIILLVVMLIRNHQYCIKKRIDDNLQFFYIGAAAFAAGGILDLGLYNLFRKSVMDAGMFLRLGFIMFIVMMFQQIMSWISAEQRTNKRDRFINNLLRYSMSGDSPEKIIHQMLEYFGNEMKADRAYIFEDMWDGTFNNTYEWCREGVTSEINNLQKVSFEGAIELWYREFEKANCVLIRDINEYNDIAGAAIYNLLKPKGIETLVTGPLEIRGKYIGFFGVENPPVELMSDISETLRLLGYFITVVLRQRDDQKRLINYSYFDQMTGAKNRRAQQEFIDNGLDRASSYGFVMCDINGLKSVNDNEGHEAGDRMICDVADVLIMVFGNDHVYRLGGDEFSAFGTWKTRGDFFYAIENVRELLRAKGRSVSLGYVYRSEGDEDFDAVKSEADELMYADKAAYYASHPELNRRS